MTETDWLAADDPEPMLTNLRSEAGDRKLLLFAVACCQRFRHHLEDERSRRVLDAAEGFADAEVTRGEFNEAGEHSENALDEIAESRVVAYAAAETAMTVAKDWYLAVVQSAVWIAARDNPTAVWDEALHAAERSHQYQLLCCLIGPLPARPVALDPAWLTSSVVGVAHAIHDARAFDDLPILADALQDVGCDDAGVLGHCRGGGPHARGCWVVDLVLGKG